MEEKHYNSNVTYADTVQIDFGIPYKPVPSMAELGKMKKQDLMDLLEIREHIKKAQKVNPLKYNWRLIASHDLIEHWLDADVHVLFGGNRSGKTTMCASVMLCLAEIIPEAELYCWAVNQKNSVEIQQEAIHDALPEKYKKLGRSSSGKWAVSFSQKNGFVDNVLILPAKPGFKKGSKITFMTYEQYKANPKMAEGWKAHAIWCDEEPTAKLFNTLQYRLSDYKGKLLISFTTVDGYTTLIRELTTGATTLKERYAPVVKRNLPVLQKMAKWKGLIYYVWTEDNPFNSYSHILSMVSKKSEEEILARLYGIASKKALAKFPKFRYDKHVIDKAPWEGVTDPKAHNHISKFTKYMIIDPAGSKNWFITWVAVDYFGTYYVYREFPDYNLHGAWAQAGNKEEEAGFAQKGLGWGYLEYIEYIRKVENGETIVARLIDPHLGKATVQALTGTTSILQNMYMAGMPVLAAPGFNIEEGLQRINDQLTYDPTDSASKPKLYFVKDCLNTISAIQEYAGAGYDDPHKDPIDNLRYLFTARLGHMSTEEKPVTIGAY